MCLFILLIASGFVCGKKGKETGHSEMEEEFNKRMTWWREARFGLFIHWGLYAIPAGEWKGETRHAEWILTTAQIPVKEYEQFAPQFKPVKFNAAEWARMAKDAGMKYIVITSKHHDGFCLFDSKLTEYDVMDATPFKRDILRELADECRKEGLKMCWYHSIMDWHHPDYLPRRNWEKRSVEGADYDRYVQHMKSQVKELMENYGDIGVLWFDGEWEFTWDYERGKDLYDFVRSLQPNIIINNRVGKGRAGMAGTYDPQISSGDFGTPEQEIPATGLGYDWETCMTMNDHWGYNKHDDNWKSTEDLIRKLVDIASKGGNFLLNVGPTSEGLFPQASVDRLAEIGQWMKTNNKSIYGTTASLFEKLDWGRSTTKKDTLYFHIFEWPEDGILRIPGLLTQARTAYLLAEPDSKLAVKYEGGAAHIALPEMKPNPIDTVLALEFSKKPEVVQSPEIKAENDIFVEKLQVEITSNLKNVEIWYTLDGKDPAKDSLLYEGSIQLNKTSSVKCQIFRDGQPISGIVEQTFTKVTPRVSKDYVEMEPGLEYSYYHGDWNNLPNLAALKPEESGVIESFNITGKKQPEFFGFRFQGIITIPRSGVYKFGLVSDDGSRLWIGEELIVDNDGLHGSTQVVNRIALQSGAHPIRVEFFQKTGGVDFEVFYSGPGIIKRHIPADVLFHKKK